MKWLSVIFATCVLAKQKCPSTRPWAYRNGDYCCATNREKIASKDGSLCDGSIIELKSTCCKNDDYSKCPSPPCTNKFDGKCHCSENTSYAYEISTLQ